MRTRRRNLTYFSAILGFAFAGNAYRYAIENGDSAVIRNLTAGIILLVVFAFAANGQ